MEIDIKNIGKMSPEELKATAEAYHEEFTNIITAKILPELKSLLILLDSVISCKQYQLAIMDTESMRENLEDLQKNGPAPRLKEIPIEASQVEDDFEFEDEVEIEYAQEDQSTQPVEES